MMKAVLIALCLSAFLLCGDAWIWGRRSTRPPHDINSQSGLTALYNKRVTKAERMERPLQGFLGNLGLPHAGVRVTTSNGEKWLVHKTKTYGNSKTVVTNARHMSSAWSVKETSQNINAEGIDIITSWQQHGRVALMISIGGATNARVLMKRNPSDILWSLACGR